MTLAGGARAFLLDHERRRQGEWYGRRWQEPEIVAWQLRRFSLLWAEARRAHPELRERIERREPPAQIRDMGEFRSAFEPMDRRAIQRLVGAGGPTAKRSYRIRTTGGSTAEPLQIPIRSGEARVARSDLWLARSWFGISPSDRLFLIWGHGHSLGGGVPGRLRAALRGAMDTVLGYRRASAYRLGRAALREAGRRLLEFRPAYLLGYSVALDRFAAENEHLRDRFQRLGLKAVIATAESFPRSDSRDRIADVLGCPVVMEYGTVECGPIAHEHPDGGYFVFWRHHLVETAPSALVPGAQELLVTSLYPRAVPLVRYRVGDLVVPAEPGADSVTRLERVVGRCNDCIMVGDGEPIHSEAFSHALRDMAAISRYQVVQDVDGRVGLEYEASRALRSDEIAAVRARLGGVHPALGNIEMQRRRQLPQTMAGKSRPVRSHHAGSRA